MLLSNLVEINAGANIGFLSRRCRCRRSIGRADWVKVLGCSYFVRVVQLARPRRCTCHLPRYCSWTLPMKAPRPKQELICCSFLLRPKNVNSLQGTDTALAKLTGVGAVRTASSPKPRPLAYRPNAILLYDTLPRKQEKKRANSCPLLRYKID